MSENLQEVIFNKPTLSEAVYKDNDLKEIVTPKKINNPELEAKKTNVLLGE